MRLPRDLTGEELIKKLIHLNYQVTRQNGSHIRLTRIFENTDYHLTIPNHSPIRVGTLNNILSDVAIHLQTTKTELIKKLF